MRILWLINLPLPEASTLLGEKPSPYGGWLVSASKYLARQDGVELTIAFPKNGFLKPFKLSGETINYYAFKPVRDQDIGSIKVNSSFEKIISEVNPDLVHIYGTEFPHTLAIVNVCKKENIETVISIQGLVSVIAQHLYANLPFKAIYGLTFRNIIRKDNVAATKKKFEKRGKNELKALQKINHIIGRTTWDKVCTSQINPDAKYHFCNETLRDEFYKYKWDINKCEKYSLFLSQGQYSAKGLHYMLEAMPYILRKFPNAKIYISGKDITKLDSIKDRIFITYYGKYIRETVKKYNLEKHIIFTGPLDERAMCERHLKSHVFVCPSSIENSPNSLGEAMLLGVPSVGSNVGGVPDMLKHTEEGFVYQADAPYMLAHYVCEIFSSDELALKFSNNARSHALEIHDSITNTDRLLEIYEEILKERIGIGIEK